MSKDSRPERWPLPSGVWQRDAASRRWELAATPGGQPASPAIPQADLYQLLGARSVQSQQVGALANAPRFPPEFRFSPESGEALTAAPTPDAPAWIPPFGASPVADPLKQGGELRGLHQAASGVRLRPAPASGRAAQATDDASHSLALPPPGRYEFCVARLGAQQDVLLAIEPERGGLFVWLALSQLWLPLEPKTPGLLADASVPVDRWRMELLVQGDQAATTTLVMPTVSGLAVVQADVLSLGYSVAYVGDGPALGAPIFWSGEAWAPIRAAETGLSLVNASGGVVPLASPAAIESFAPPVCDSRQIVWPCEQGQLVVRKGSGGEPEVSWVEWPAGVKPRFEFGSPYLSRSGSFWQMAWDDAAGAYVYVQMGRPQPEVHGVGSPRFGTGSLSYLQGQRIKGDPWLDPEHAVEANSDEVVLPLLESARQAAVLGLVVESTSGVTALLESKDRQRAELQFQADNSPDLRFFTLLVARPWRARVFVYDQRLWIYHPDLPYAYGWDLEK